MMDVGYGAAFLAGLLSFFSPCVLPIVPFYLSYMAGASMQEISGKGELAPGVRRRAFWASVMFSAGIITVFVLLGAEFDSEMERQAKRDPAGEREVQAGSTIPED